MPAQAIAPGAAGEPRKLRLVRTTDRSDEPRRFFSVAEVAQMFGTSEMTLYRAIKAGEFPAIRIRGRLIVPAKVLDAMVDAALSGHTVVDAADWVTGGAA